jgi:hypothetical protein
MCDNDNMEILPSVTNLISANYAGTENWDDDEYQKP